MGQHKLIRQPVAFPVATDEITFRSCCTEVFRWVRKSIDIAEQSPGFLQSCAEDVAAAWEDSAKK
jgi:hypothetical protein